MIFFTTPSPSNVVLLLLLQLNSFQLLAIEQDSVNMKFSADIRAGTCAFAVSGNNVTIQLPSYTIEEIEAIKPTSGGNIKIKYPEIKFAIDCPAPNMTTLFLRGNRCELNANSPTWSICSSKSNQSVGFLPSFKLVSRSSPYNNKYIDFNKPSDDKNYIIFVDNSGAHHSFIELSSTDGYLGRVKGKEVTPGPLQFDLTLIIATN